MRILHTSDWHLGHTLHEHPREQEHRAFLKWLLETMGVEQVDALVICGDVFDSANPSAQSQKIWYGFLADAHRLLPDLDIVVIGGNHDSAARLDAPTPLLESMRIHVTGGLPYLDGGGIDWDQLIVPLHNKDGAVAAWLASVPFLRQADLPPVQDSTEDALVEGMRTRYAEAISALRRQAAQGQGLIVTGHCYLSGAVLSELSERKILGGNQHALPNTIFPDDISYVALGHLHLAQAVGGREHVRYSGSPLPLSVSEIHYTHQVCLVDLEDGRCSSLRQIPVPRMVAFLRIPSVGSLPVDDLLKKLEELPDAGTNTDRSQWPYLEVAPRIDKPRPGLREELLQALGDKAVRLVKIASASTAVVPANSVVEGASLDDITPEEVFVRCYSSRFPDQPPPDYMAAFNELLHQVKQSELQL